MCIHLLDTRWNCVYIYTWINVYRYLFIIYTWVYSYIHIIGKIVSYRFVMCAHTVLFSLYRFMIRRSVCNKCGVIRASAERSALPFTWLRLCFRPFVFCLIIIEIDKYINIHFFIYVFIFTYIYIYMYIYICIYIYKYIYIYTIILIWGSLVCKLSVIFAPTCGVHWLFSRFSCRDLPALTSRKRYVFRGL